MADAPDSKGEFLLDTRSYPAVLPKTAGAETGAWRPQYQRVTAVESAATTQTRHRAFSDGAPRVRGWALSSPLCDERPSQGRSLQKMVSFFGHARSSRIRVVFET